MGKSEGFGGKKGFDPTFQILNSGTHPTALGVVEGQGQLAQRNPGQSWWENTEVW